MPKGPLSTIEIRVTIKTFENLTNLNNQSSFYTHKGPGQTITRWLSNIWDFLLSSNPWILGRVAKMQDLPNIFPSIGYNASTDHHDFKALLRYNMLLDKKVVKCSAKNFSSVWQCLIIWQRPKYGCFDCPLGLNLWNKNLLARSGDKLKTLILSKCTKSDINCLKNPRSLNPSLTQMFCTVSNPDHTWSLRKVTS